MFSLLGGCYEWLVRKEELHILIIGLDGGGKSLTLERIKALFTGVPALDPDKMVPTVGLNIARFDAYGSPLVLWDLGGQAGLRSIWDKYYSESHALVFVVDAASRQRLDEAKAALERALGEGGGCGGMGPAGWHRCWRGSSLRGGGARRRGVGVLWSGCWSGCSALQRTLGEGAGVRLDGGGLHAGLGGMVAEWLRVRCWWGGGRRAAATAAAAAMMGPVWWALAGVCLPACSEGCARVAAWLAPQLSFSGGWQYVCTAAARRRRCCTPPADCCGPLLLRSACWPPRLTSPHHQPHCTPPPHPLCCRQPRAVQRPAAGAGQQTGPAGGDAPR